MNKKLYSEEQVLEAMKFASSHLSSIDGINKYFATLTPEPSSSDLIDRKEVEKILKDEINKIHSEWGNNMDDDEWSRYKRNVELLFERISSLPSASAVEDMGWTKEQVIQAVRNEIADANAACGHIGRTDSDLQTIGIVTSALNRLSPPAIPNEG